VTGSLRYLLALGACCALTFPLEFVFGARVFRRPRRLILTLLPVVAVFVAWDLMAHARGHWSYSDRYTIGLHLLGLPVEEWLFFIVIPVCALLGYEAFAWRPSRRRVDEDA
jgi:lycopene cyclase domain-containing protein